MQDIKQLMSDTKFYGDYSRWQEDKQRYESWDEAVDRVMNMHKDKYNTKMSTELKDMIGFVSKQYKQKNILGAQRALQFGGEQLMRHNSKLYNCSSSYVDRLEFFQEAMYLLLCWCGVGFSVQKEHIKMLPNIYPRDLGIKQHVIEDSIEGWADAFGNNLWKACDTLQGFGENLTEENHNNTLKRDWIRRANKFNNNYFNDIIKMISCLKDCYNLHKWNKIMVNFKEIDLQKSLKKKDFVAVDTIAGAACSGGVCEIIF